MSLESLTKLRVYGGTPPAVWVVIGDCPERLRNLPDTIEVKSNPGAMDWRSVVGLHVDIFDLADDDMLLLRTMDAIEAAKPKAIGVACQHAVMGLSEQHERAMSRIWSRLANPA